MVLIAIIPFILALRLAAPVIKKGTKLRSLKWFQVLKPSQNKKGRNVFLAAPKTVSFSHLLAVKKTQFLVQLEIFLALFIL
jgi:hypothetical protein